MFIYYQIKAVFVSLFLLIFVLLPTVLLAIPFPLKRRLKIICPVWQFCSHMLLRFGLTARLSVEEDHRSPEFRTIPGYGLYICNHQSFVDIPLCFTIFQIPPIMKKEILYIPIFGWLAWFSGAMPVSRSSNSSRKKVFFQARRRFKEMKLGVQLYPEGTRSRDGHLKGYSEIKKSLLVFAFNEKIPVIPASLYGTREVLYPFGLLRAHRHIGIIVHKEIDPENFEDGEEFARACWAKVHEGHVELKRRLVPLDGN